MYTTVLKSLFTLLIIIQFFTVSTLFAHPPATGFSSTPLSVKDKLHINAGIGLSSWGVPIYGGLDYGVHRSVTVGGLASFSNHSEGNVKTTVIMLGGRVNYHFNELFKLKDNRWDIYGGGTLGYFIWNWENNFPGAKTSGAGLYLQIGSRYYFSPNWAANLELGGGSVSGGRLGITYRM